MNIKISKIEKKTIIEVSGRVDTVAAPKFEAAVKEQITDAEELVIDMDKLEYISSAGLRVLLWAQKTMTDRGDMKLINVHENVMEILEITGFSEILKIKQGGS